MANNQVVKKDINKVSVKELVLTFPKKQFIASGGTEEDFVREAGFALQVIDKTPYLLKCDRKSLVNAIANVAMTGLSLNPELRLGYLIPRKGKVYFQSSYMGKVELLIRSGMVKDIYAKLVYENDTFEVDGDIITGKPIHKANYFGDRGKVIGGYYVAKLVNGEVKWDTMPMRQILEAKKRSEAVKADKTSPWDTDEEEMMRKTIINWAFKFIPKSNISKSVLQAIESDSEYDRDMFDDWKKKQEAEAKDDFYSEEYSDYTEVKDNHVNVDEHPVSEEEAVKHPMEEN
jgi:recombination protein RecT